MEMRGAAFLMGLVLLLTACTSADVDAVVPDSEQSTPTTTAASVPEETEALEMAEDQDILVPRVFVCPGGETFELDHGESPTIGSTVLTLADGTERLGAGDWLEAEVGFVDTAALEHENKTAFRMVDIETGVEQVCPETGSAGLLPSGGGPAQVNSCEVSAPWGVMGGQQVTYLGSRGDEGSVDIYRNGDPTETMIVGLTWEDLLAIRQAETSDEASTPPSLFGRPGEIFYSDFGSPSGELSYALVVRDEEDTEVQRVECGSVTVPSIDSVTCSLDLLDGAPRLTISGGAFPEQIRRNGQPIEYSREIDGLVDANAPAGEELEYEVTVSAPMADDGERVVPCGSIEATDVPLEQRLRSLEESIRAAHWYAEVSPVCPGCDETPLLLGWNGAQAFRWEDATFTALVESDTVDPWFLPPGEVPGFLLDSLEAGREVDARFDGRELSSWTVDGSGAQYRCLEGDTAPVEIRMGYHQSWIDDCLR